MTEFYQPIVDFKSFAVQPINEFALQQALKVSGVRYEYLIGGSWREISPVEKLEDPPEGKRVLFSDINLFRKARETYFAWIQLKRLFGKERPEFPEKIYERLWFAAYSSNPLTIFIPWGFRPQGSFGEKEVQAMNQIDLAINSISQRQIPIEVLIMPADLYATEINGQDEPTVRDYFSAVEQEALGRGYKCHPWSEIRANNYVMYTQLCLYYTDQALKSALPSQVIESAITASKKRTLPEKTAVQYLRERLCEARIIEEVHRPIKLSMVAKNKDNGVDLELPRLYVLPTTLQFPWL